MQNGRVPNTIGNPFRAALFVAGAIAASAIGCKAAPGLESRELGCGRLPGQRGASLCERIQAELEYTRGGHALLIGSLGYRCTEQTLRDVFCGRASPSTEEVNELLQSAEAAGEMDVRLYACLLGLRRAAEQAAMPAEKRHPGLAIACGRNGD